MNAQLWKTTKRAALAAALLCLPASSPAAEQPPDPLAPFPKAEAGFERRVIRLPKLEDENDYEVEILVGKTISVDSCNRYSFMGSLEERTVQGWGYSYWVLPKVAGPMSTLMACFPRGRHDAFVRVSGDGYLLRYNSRLPVVIHVPEGFAVRYRLWKAQEEIREATAE